MDMLRRISAWVVCLAPLLACQTPGGTAGKPLAVDTARAATDPSFKGFQNDDEFREWFSYYYVKPKPEQLTEAMKHMDQFGYLEQFPDIASAFLTHVLKSNPDRLDQWCAEWRPLSPKAWNVIVLSLWLADTPASGQLARESLKQLQDSARPRFEAMLNQSPKSMDLITTPVRSPRQINVIWAAFSATGDPIYVEKVISYVHLYKSSGESWGAPVGETALMSLANNALTHATVSKVCEEEANGNPNPLTQNLLGTLLRVVADSKARQNASPELPAH